MKINFKNIGTSLDYLIEPYCCLFYSTHPYAQIAETESLLTNALWLGRPRVDVFFSSSAKSGDWRCSSKSVANWCRSSANIGPSIFEARPFSNNQSAYEACLVMMATSTGFNFMPVVSFNRYWLKRSLLEYKTADKPRQMRTRPDSGASITNQNNHSLYSYVIIFSTHYAYSFLNFLYPWWMTVAHSVW